MKMENLSPQIARFPESNTFDGSTHVKISSRIDNLKCLHQKLMQKNKKRLHLHWNDCEDSSNSSYEHADTLQECFCKSKKARRH
jgi:hypothetical protein